VPTCGLCGKSWDECGDYCQAIRVGDRVRFVEPGFSLSGHVGTVEGARPFALLVAFDSGSVGTWKRDYFVKEQDSEGKRVCGDE
jgi:hypothetical protein